MPMTIHEVLRHVVEHTHFGSEDNRKEALEAVDKEYGKSQDTVNRDLAGERNRSPDQAKDSGNRVSFDQEK